MNIVRQAEAPVFSLPGLTVTGLASPSRGSAETCVWRISVAPGTPGFPHSVTREEIFVGLSGRATVTVDGKEHALGPGDAFIAPAGKVFALANTSTEPFEAIVSLPVGGQAVAGGAPPFTPPWAV